MATGFREVPIEAVRDFWNARPCNIRHSRKPVGEREYFDEVEARKYFVEPHIPRFAEFGRWASRDVLEVGCGIGTDTIEYTVDKSPLKQGKYTPGMHIPVYPVEKLLEDQPDYVLSDRSLDLARRRAAIYGLDNIRFVHANVEELSWVLQPASFDLVYSFGVIHHTPRPDIALRELVALLRPGGTLKIMVYHRRSWKVAAIVATYGRGAFWDLDRIVARHSEAQEGCPVTYTYTREQARRMVEEAGCRVVDLFVDHIFAWRIPDYVNYRYRKVWYFRMLPPPVFRWLERRAGWHLCVTAVK